MAANPLRSDPSRLAGPRRSLATAVRLRFALLRRSLRRLIAGEDALGLLPASTGRWAGLDAAGKVTAFQGWLDAEVGGVLLGDSWWTRHLTDAYLRGASRSYTDVRRPTPGVSADAARQEFLRLLMRGGPLSSDDSRFTINARHGLRDVGGRFASKKVLALAARLSVELKGATDAMAQRIARAVLDGLDQEQTPTQVAKAIGDAVGIGERRALLIATTELTRSHAEGQLDAIEALGLDEVAVMAEWQTADDPCPQCAPLDGVVFKLEEARGLIPRHPRCACVFVLSEAGKHQRTTKRDTQRAVRKSVKAEGGKTRWRGASVAITKRGR